MGIADEYMTTKEVCEALRVARRTVYRWVKQGKITQASRVGRLSFYRRSDIEALLDPEVARRADGEAHE